MKPTVLSYRWQIGPHMLILNCITHTVYGPQGSHSCVTMPVTASCSTFYTCRDGTKHIKNDCVCFIRCVMCHTTSKNTVILKRLWIRTTYCGRFCFSSLQEEPCMFLVSRSLKRRHTCLPSLRWHKVLFYQRAVYVQQSKANKVQPIVSPPD